MHRICMIPLFFFCLCTREIVAPPEGRATWATDCSKVVVAINRSHEVIGLLGSYKTDQRYDLILCDTLAQPIDTILSGRALDGNNCSVDQLYYDPSAGYIIVESFDLTNGGLWQEHVYLDGTAVRVYDTLRLAFNKLECAQRRLWWDDSTNFYYVSGSVEY